LLFLAQLADEVLSDKWDNGAERERLFVTAGYDCNAVQKRVNEKPYKKTVDEIAVGVWVTELNARKGRRKPGMITRRCSKELISLLH
jgi:hypothetical protein